MRDRMTGIVMMAFAAAAFAGCEQTDVPDQGQQAAPGEEREATGSTRAVEPVELDTLAWLQEGRTVTFNGQSYVLTGEPVYDPAVEHVGEFEGTPLYGEVGVSAHRELFIPLENDYWQRLERGVGTPAGPGGDTTEDGLIDIR